MGDIILDALRIERKDANIYTASTGPEHRFGECTASPETIARNNKFILISNSSPRRIRRLVDSLHRSRTCQDDTGTNEGTDCNVI